MRKNNTKKTPVNSPAWGPIVPAFRPNRLVPIRNTKPTDGQLDFWGGIFFKKRKRASK
jgi:hypothetical protein